MRKESLGNSNHSFNDLKMNKSYSKTLEIFENNYFSTKFNTSIDEILSNSSQEDLFIHYINYLEISEIFFSMYSQDNIINLNSYLNIENVSQNKLRLLFLLIYKELHFFSVKIEDFLNIDSKHFNIEKNDADDILSIRINDNDNEIYKVKNESVMKLKEGMLSYYCSSKKINSFINFIDKFYIE